MGSSVREYELFFDESGDFREANANEQGQEKARASQVAGLLAPRGRLLRSTAEEILRTATSAAGTQYDGSLHATEMPRDKVEGILVEALPLLEKLGLQPVRIVNKERVDFGDKRATYTNLVAELALRCLQEIARDGDGPIKLYLRPAGVWDDRLNREYTPDDYHPPLQEALVRAAVRRGLASQQRTWQLAPEIRFLSGRRDPEIFLCDLVSNTSYGNFRRLTKAGADALRRQFGRFDFSMALRADVEQVEAYCDQAAYGMAAAMLADRFDAQGADSGPIAPLQALLPQVVRGLANLGAPARNAQWETLLSHVEQTIQSLRDLEKGRRLCAWIQAQLLQGVARELPKSERAELEWVRYATLVHALNGANHRGDLAGARQALDELQRLKQKIVRRFERIDLFLQAQVHAAVHRTDTREFDAAMALAESVARFYRDVGELLHAAMPEALPEKVWSDRRGHALGTAMQAAMYASQANPELRAHAERLGDEALAEFDNEIGRSRQRQYRCQLATIAGDLPTARRWLAQALGLEADDATSLAQAVGTTPPERGQAFVLLHLARMAAVAHRLAPHGSEAQAWQDALAAARIRELPPVRETRGEHPGPTILRYLGEVESLRGEANAAIGTLRRVVAVTAGQTGALAGLPVIALQARITADAIAAGDAKLAQRTLGGDGKELPSLGSAMASLRRKLVGLSGWTAMLDRWMHAAEIAAAGSAPESAQRTLSALGTEILY